MKIESLRNNLEHYRIVLNAAEPTEEDFQAVDQLVTARLEHDEIIIISDKPDDQSVILEREFTEVLPLFEGNELSPGQKSALFIILERYLSTLKNL